MYRSEHTVHVPTEIRKLIEESKSVQCFEKGLQRLNKQHRVPLNLLRTHALHQACGRDDATLVEFLLKNLPDTSREVLINSPLGTHSYTPLFRAAYAGSVRMLKYLISLGARSDYHNVHGEDVLSCIDVGLSTRCVENPDDEIFLKDRFDECKEYILKHRKQIDEKSGLQDHKKTAYVPKHVIKNRAASTIALFWRARQKRKAANETTGSVYDDDFKVVHRKKKIKKNLRWERHHS